MDSQEKSKLLKQIVEHGARVKNNTADAMSIVLTIREIAGDYLNEQSFTPQSELPPCYLNDIKRLPCLIESFDHHLKQWQEFSASVHAFLDHQDKLQTEAQKQYALKEEVADHPDFFKWVEEADSIGVEGPERYLFIQNRFDDAVSDFILPNEAEPRREANKDAEQILQTIQSYLETGGLFNPEQMEHDKVRDLVIRCRDVINELRQMSN